MKLQRFNEARLNTPPKGVLIEDIDQFILNLKDICVLANNNDINFFHVSNLYKIHYFPEDINTNNIYKIIRDYKLLKYEISFVERWNILSKSISYFETKIDELFDIKTKMSWNHTFELHLSTKNNKSINSSELVDLSQEIKSFAIDINQEDLLIGFFSGTIILTL